MSSLSLLSAAEISKNKLKRTNPAYKAIAEFYGKRTAQRSGVKLMNHIDEGLLILSAIGADQAVQEAYCLHPIFQSEEDFQANWEQASRFSSLEIALTLEYRHKANRYLCRPDTAGYSVQDLSRVVGPLIPSVRLMLIADKVQNQKDFLTYHYGTHKNSSQLYTYFQNWLNYLEVPAGVIESLHNLIDGWGR